MCSPLGENTADQTGAPSGIVLVHFPELRSQNLIEESREPDTNTFKLSQIDMEVTQSECPVTVTFLFMVSMSVKLM